jgi:sugar/nucleoside kinase (ribokinase family)
MNFGSAAVLCITREGAMPSMPKREEVDKFIQ